MSLRLRFSVLMLSAIVAVAMLGIASTASADSWTHKLSGVVKSVDKDSKTMVVKAADGTEHTIKYTDKTSIEGAKDAAGDVKEGAHVSVEYTEKGGEKTATGVKDIGKEADKAK